MKTFISPALLVLALLAGCGSDKAPAMNACPPDTGPTCGNGTIEVGEECDPGDGVTFDFGNQTCTTLGMGDGPLRCQCCMLLTDMCTGITPQFNTAGGNGG